MKKEIHPLMHSKAKTVCTSCKAVFEIPSVEKEQQVEVCRMCHPVYTGKRRLDQKGGRIERFKKRAAAKKK